MINPRPNRIYLQTETDLWSEYRINDTDIEYIRADEIRAVHEQYKHLDILSDREWLPKGLIGKILADLWDAITQSLIPST